jgi:hypothetical protein
MDKIRVGYVALSKTSFDIVLAQETYEQSIASVRALANVEPLIFDGVVATMDDAERASAFFEAQRPDLLIIQCATFHIGSLPQIITRHVTAPLVLWGVPEPPMNGEHLRANSLCAINMDASTFKKTGRKYTTLFGAPDDPETIKEVLDVMIDLAQEGMTMIVVTHEMGFAKSVAHRVIFMDFGKIVEGNSPEEFFRNPRHERTRLFLSQILH